MAASAGLRRGGALCLGCALGPGHACTVWLRRKGTRRSGAIWIEEHLTRRSFGTLTRDKKDPRQARRSADTVCEGYRGWGKGTGVRPRGQDAVDGVCLISAWSLHLESPTARLLPDAGAGARGDKHVISEPLACASSIATGRGAVEVPLQAVRRCESAASSSRSRAPWRVCIKAAQTHSQRRVAAATAPG